MPQRLPGHKHIIGSDRFARGFQRREHRACNAGIVVFERKDENRTGEECLEPRVKASVTGVTNR